MTIIKNVLVLIKLVHFIIINDDRSWDFRNDNIFFVWCMTPKISQRDDLFRKFLSVMIFSGDEKLATFFLGIYIFAWWRKYPSVTVFPKNFQRGGFFFSVTRGRSVMRNNFSVTRDAAQNNIWMDHYVQKI